MGATIGLTLSTEGPSDQVFFSPIVQRLTQELTQVYIAAEDPIQEVIFAEVRDLNTLGRSIAGDVYDRLRGAARIGAKENELVFVHADGAGDRERMEETVCKPKIDAILGVMAGNTRHVRVVPVREMEAWAVADGDAIRRAYKVTLDDARLGVVHPRRLVEGIGDPKERLNEIAECCLGKRRARKLGVTVFLSLIGQYISFETMRDVPSFRRFYDESEAAVKDLLSAITLANRKAEDGAAV